MTPRARQRGYLLAEVLVYIAVLPVIVGTAWLAYYRFDHASRGLTRNTDDIVRILRAGERWREDVRAATAAPSMAGGMLRLPHGSGEVLYRFEGTRVVRKANEAEGWVPVLTRVELSRMAPEVRKHVAAWRWEVKLEPWRTGTVRSHFGFLAVPPSVPER